MSQQDQEQERDQEIASRLSHITTQWTRIRSAHGTDSTGAVEARAKLIDRYHRAAYRYLAAVLGDADAAEEVFQDFAFQMLNGRLRHASPERGRFRSYLKKALISMAIDYRRRKARHGAKARNFDEQSPEEAWQRPAEDRHFDELCRQELLNRAWQALKRQSSPARPFHAVLNHRSDWPKATSSQMAADLSRQLDRDEPYSAAAVRKLLERARRRFAQLLVDEIADSIGSARADDVEQELADLELLSYCHSAVERLRERNSS